MLAGVRVTSWVDDSALAEVGARAANDGLGRHRRGSSVASAENFHGVEKHFCMCFLSHSQNDLTSQDRKCIHSPTRPVSLRGTPVQKPLCLCFLSISFSLRV